MQNRLDVGPRLLDRGMDETLVRKWSSLAFDWRAVERKGEDVGGNDGARALRARKQEPRCVGRIAKADVPEGVDNAEIGQNPIRDHQVFDRTRG